MRIAYLECFSGMSGDMFLGALVDAGVPPRCWRRRSRRSTSARVWKFRELFVAVSRRPRWTSGSMARRTCRAKNTGRNKSSRSTGIVMTMGTATSIITIINTLPSPMVRGRGRPHHIRTLTTADLTEIREIIGKAAISDSAKKTAIAIFEALGAAEAKIHATSIEKVHFHEVGAVDAMVDIVCAAVGAEALGVDEIVCSPLNVGGGTVKCAHGTFPVPAPATVELLKDAPVYSSGVQAELVTPTGAAIVKTSGEALRGVSGDEDREGGIRRGNARVPRLAKRGAVDDR